jgi:hypothetical protein
MVMSTLTFISVFVLSPRFMISVRELYSHSLLRVSGRHEGIDAGFGMSKSPRVTYASSVGFADSTLCGTTEGDLEMRGMGSKSGFER